MNDDFDFAKAEVRYHCTFSRDVENYDLYRHFLATSAWYNLQNDVMMVRWIIMLLVSPAFEHHDVT